MCSVYSYHYLIFSIHHVSGCLHVTVPGVFLKIYEIIGYFLSIFVLKDVSGLFFTCNLENSFAFYTNTIGYVLPHGTSGG